MLKQKYKRRRYLVKKRFQLKYTALILSTLLLVMLVSGIGLYVGMRTSIVENFSEFKVSQELETAKRIADYEGVRYKKGDYRLEKIFREAELLSKQQSQALKNALRAVNRSLFPKIALIALLIFVGGIFASHKIAGPMYKFEQSAEAVKDGDLRVDFKLRKSDEMKNTASILDDMVESLRCDIEKIKKANTMEETRKIISKYKT